VAKAAECRPCCVIVRNISCLYFWLDGVHGLKGGSLKKKRRGLQ